MLNRRQFLIGMGAVTVSAAVSLLWKNQPVLPQEKRVDIPEKLPDLDWVIDNVIIVDGTGDLPYSGRLGVLGEEIVALGNFTLPPHVRVIDGEGLCLAPGFIDIHTHTEDYIRSGESLAPILSQGVTTQVGGNCGSSPLDIEAYLQSLPPLGINFGILMGYGALRQRVLGGKRAGKINPSQLQQMQELLAKAFEAGALGLSSGLEYWPQHYALPEEITQLCTVVREYNRFYATHIRSEYNLVLEGLEEAIETGLKAGVPVQYSHIKAGYRENWPKFPRVLDMLQEARDSGLDITADVYPYTFSSMDIGTKPLRHSMSQENVEMAVKNPLVFFASDTGLYQGGRANHPRAYGTFPRFLGMMAREKKILTLQEAVKKMTADPAKRLKIQNRGLLAPGFKADLVLFDPTKVQDRSTYESPQVFSEGVRQVWVNGALTWSGENVLESRKGQLLRPS